MMQEDESPADPGTPRIETKENSSLTTGLPGLEKTSSTTEVASYEYMGTTFYQHEVPASFRHKPLAGTNDGIKSFSEEAVAYRSHRTPANIRGRGVSWSDRGVPWPGSGGRGVSWPDRGAPWPDRGGRGVSWPRKSLLSSFGEADLTHNFKIQDSLAMRRDSKFSSSWNATKSEVCNTPLYTKSGQPYVPISIANWYRTRVGSGEYDEIRSEPESMPICLRDKGVLSLGSREDSFAEKSSRRFKGQSEELENEEANDMVESLLNRDNEFFKVEAIEDLSVKDLKCLKLTTTPAKALVRIFEPMLESWKEVISAVPDTSDKKNVNEDIKVNAENNKDIKVNAENNEDIKENADKPETTVVVESECKENGDPMPILPRNEKQSIILEEMSQKLLGDSAPVSPPQIPLPQKRQDKSVAKNREIKEQVQCKESSFLEDLAYANSYSPATGLRMMEASSIVRNYVFTIGDRGEISRFLTPLVKELVVINKLGGKGMKCKLQIGVIVESQHQFFGAIKAANTFFKLKEFQFKPLANIGNASDVDVLNGLSSCKVIPKVDRNGMYQITVKFNLPKGNEKKVDESLGEELEREVQGCGVEKISIGPGERILQLGHVEDMLKASKKIKKVFEIIPSKHIWNNEIDRVRNDEERKKRQTLKRKEGKAENKLQSNRQEAKVRNKEQSNRMEAKAKNKEQSNRMEAKPKNKEQSTRMEVKAKNKEKSNRKETKAKNKEQSNKVALEINDSSNLKPNAVQKSNTLDLNLPMIQQEKVESAPLLSNQSITLTLIDSDSACDPSEMRLESSEYTRVIISHDPNKSAMRSPPPGDGDNDRREMKTSPLTSLIRLMEGGNRNSNLKLLQDSFVKCPNDNEENEDQAFEMLEKAMASGDVDGEMQKKAMAAGNDNGKKLENGMAAKYDDNDKMLEKAVNAGDDIQNIKSKIYSQSQDVEDLRKENFRSKNEVCQLGEENKLIFQSIDEHKIENVKEDTNWYGNVSDFVTIKNNCSLWNVHVIFEAKEAAKIAYFGLREKYNGVDGGCEINI